MKENLDQKTEAADHKYEPTHNLFVGLRNLPKMWVEVDAFTPDVLSHVETTERLK